MATKKAAAKKAKADEKDAPGVATGAMEEVGTQGPSNDPENAMSDIRDHSVSPKEMSELRGAGEGLKGAKLAAADDSTAEGLEAETAVEKREEDTSVYGRLSRSGLVLNEDQTTGERWVGISAQQDPEYPAHLKNKVRVTPLAEVRPWKGLTVRPKNGEPFAVPDHIDRDATPADWLAMVNPATGKPFLEGV
jgi:hypothetical protein